MDLSPKRCWENQDYEEVGIETAEGEGEEEGPEAVGRGL